jgi:CubicO group peptidase (beta-lactamase class C family)
MNMRPVAAWIGLCVLCGSAVAAQAPFEQVSAEQAGFSSERLKRLDQFYQDSVDRGEIPGAVVMLLRDGKVFYERAFGYADRDRGAKMTTDTVFWIASMSKPVTAVAAMTLAEAGQLDLQEKVSTYLPELQNLQVGVESTDAATGQRTLKLEPARRPPTIQDLLRHTSGFVYGALGPGLVNQRYVDDHVMDNNITTAEMVKRLAKIPLAHEPGSTFEYSLSVDILGRAVEVVSKQPLDRYIEEHIAKPLGMDTLKFHVIKGRQWAWSAINAGRDKTTDARTWVRTDPKFLMGGGGLYCAVEDYARFATMLMRGGELSGERILSPSAVALMTHNHLGPNVVIPDYMRSLLQDIAPSPEMGLGFGLGFAVRLDEGRNSLPGGTGDYFWAGAGGTYFWNDPAHGLTALAWVPVANGELERKYRQYSRQMIYQAMERR